MARVIGDKKTYGGRGSMVLREGVALAMRPPLPGSPRCGKSVSQIKGQADGGMASSAASPHDVAVARELAATVTDSCGWCSVETSLIYQYGVTIIGRLAWNSDWRGAGATVGTRDCRPRWCHHLT